MPPSRLVATTSGSELNHPAIGRSKTACIEIEATELILEVDVQPFAAGGASLSLCDR